MAAGLSLAQIGEFSFVIGAEAMGAKLLSDDVFQLMMTSSLVTLILSPLLISKARTIARIVDSIFGSTDHPEYKAGDALSGHVVVIGYGVSGRNVVDDLIEAGEQVLVIDMGPSGIKHAREIGAFALLGNAQRRDVIEQAGIRVAKLVVLTLPDHRASAQTIMQIRSLQEEIPIIARARYSIHCNYIQEAGADVVVDEEECVGHALAKKTLKQLGM